MGIMLRVLAEWKGEQKKKYHASKAHSHASRAVTSPRCWTCDDIRVAPATDARAVSLNVTLERTSSFVIESWL